MPDQGGLAFANSLLPWRKRALLASRKDTQMTKQQTLEQIAQRRLRLETLETRKSDRLDFHEVAVWNIQEALNDAYEAGKAAASKKADKK